MTTRQAKGPLASFVLVLTFLLWVGKNLPSRRLIWSDNRWKSFASP